MKLILFINNFDSDSQEIDGHGNGYSEFLDNRTNSGEGFGHGKGFNYGYGLGYGTDHGDNRKYHIAKQRKTLTLLEE